MKIAVAGDSAGEGLAKVLADYLGDKYEVSEVSRTDEGPDAFYANLSDRVCNGVLDGTYDRAILCCGTGIGVCLSANKVPGIRAAQTHDTYSAERASLSNNAQIITMGARVIGIQRRTGGRLDGLQRLGFAKESCGQPAQPVRHRHHAQIR